MTAQFAIGLSAAVIALAASWAWRSSIAPLWARLVLPLAAVGAACCVPWLDAAMADAERVTTLDAMPPCFAVLAIRAHDAEGTVSLWIDGSGRVVRLPLDGLKDTLRDVQDALHKGEPKVRLCRNSSASKGGAGNGRGGKGEKGKTVEDGGSTSKMHIDESLFLRNQKERGQ